MPKSLAEKRDSLKKSAGDSVMFRSHHMGRWTDVDDRRAVCECERCGMQLVINAKPIPNEIDVGGEACALDCPFAKAEEDIRLCEHAEAWQRKRGERVPDQDTKQYDKMYEEWHAYAFDKA